MSTATARTRTLQKVRGTENKFYRVTTLEGAGASYSVTQWGSQRNGRHGGSYKIAPGPDLADRKYVEKAKEGYTSVGQEVTFQVDVDKFRAQLAGGGDKAAGSFIENLAAAAERGRPVINPTNPQAPFGWSGEQEKGTDVPAAVPDVVDRIGVLNDKALECIGLATSDTQKAMVMLVELREQRESIEAELRKAASYISTVEALVEEDVLA